MSPPPIPLVDLGAQYRRLKPELDAAVQGVIDSATFIGGPEVQQFEKEFASYLGVSHTVGCANGTDALELALLALQVGHGDEVLVPANTWISTAEAVTNVGATPVFVDVDPQLYTLDLASAARRLTPRTKALIPVHLYGLAAPMDEIMAWAGEHNLFVIEDCAQAHGAEYKGRKVGTFGQVAAFSFFPGKNLGAWGDAGAVVTNQAEIAERVRMLGNHGQLTKHQHQIIGRNSRLDNLQAAILRVKLRHLPDWVAARRAHAARYTELLQETGITLPHTPLGHLHAFHLYVVQVTNRDFVQAQLAHANISTAIHYPRPLPFVPAYQYVGYTAADIPAAAQGADVILSLPMYPELTPELIGRVCLALRKTQSQRATPQRKQAVGQVIPSVANQARG